MTERIPISPPETEELPAAAAAPPLVEPGGSIRRQVLRLAWPVVLQNLSRTMMILVDTAMIGQVGTAAMASMAVIGPIAHLMFAVLTVLGVATIATIARATGERDARRQRENAATSVLAAVAGGLALVAVGLVVVPWIVEAYREGSEPGVLTNAHRYTQLIVLALPFILLEEASSAALRGAGDTRTPMIFAVSANVLNVLGNYVLIFGKFGAPAMGVVGAGLSTALCFSLQGILVTLFLFTPASRVRLAPRDFARVTRESWKRLARVAGPALVEPLLINTGFLVYLKSVTLLGTAAMAAHRAAITIESLSFMPGYGFSVACSALVGQFLGARKRDEAGRAIREAVLLAALFMSGLGVIFLAVPKVLLSAFVRDDPEVVQLGALCLMIAALEQPLLGAAMSLGGGLRGAGDTRSPVWVGALAVWGVRIPLSYVLAIPLEMGLVGIWITMIADWGLRTALFAWIVRRGRWTKVPM